LAKASTARVASSREFQWIKEDMARWEKQKKDKALSLNEKTRLAERKAEEDRQAARKKERGARKEKPYASEDITLEILDGKSPAVSSSTAVARPVDPLDEDEPGFGHPADAPDAVLDETLRIAVDLAANGAGSGGMINKPEPAPTAQAVNKPGSSRPDPLTLPDGKGATEQQLP
jgi:hypothetical protein